MNRPPRNSTAHAPEQAGAGEHADATRTGAGRLKRATNPAREGAKDTLAARLVEANEQLVLTALRAETIAETATVKLDELTRVFQRDPLTGTPNRALMLDRLQNAIAMAKRHESRVAVLFVDLDDFKNINDTHGHSMGDEVLRLVARRLQAAVRDSDTVSRHGGDEFVVLLPEISHASDAGLIASEILAAIAGSAPTEAVPFAVSASIGISIYPDDGEDAATLIGRADSAMYRCKKLGGGTFQVHSNDRLQGDHAERPLAADLPPAARRVPRQGPDYRHVRNLRDANERLVLSSLVAHEVEAQAAQGRLRQAEFLAMMAHELRNPLASIRLAAELLSRARADDKEHARLQQIIQRQIAHLEMIVEELFDDAHVEAGKFHLERGTVDLTGILRLAIDSCRPMMDARVQQLTMELPDSPIAVGGDPVRLTQIFLNLLDNATKYTRRGGVISISAAVMDRAVLVTVSDNGIGIGADTLPRVFDLFVRDPRAVAMHGDGRGIGLAVARELVEAHGGSITAKSAGHDLGSEFVVSLPLVAGESAPG